MRNMCGSTLPFLQCLRVGRALNFLKWKSERCKCTSRSRQVDSVCSLPGLSAAAALPSVAVKTAALGLSLPCLGYGGVPVKKMLPFL